MGSISSRKREKIWSPKAPLQRRCKNGTAVQSQKCSAPPARRADSTRKGCAASVARLWRGRADRAVRPYIRSEMYRISYVKYSTGANVTTRTLYRAMQKPDSTVARKGVRTTESVTEIRTTERYAFSRVSAISFSSVLFFHIFSRKREKIWSPKAQLQRRCKKQHFR